MHVIRKKSIKIFLIAKISQIFFFFYFSPILIWIKMKIKILIITCHYQTSFS